jgi:hypothetical protein
MIAILAATILAGAAGGDQVQFDPDRARVSAQEDTVLYATVTCLRGHIRRDLYQGERSRARLVEGAASGCESLLVDFETKHGKTAEHAHAAVRKIAARALDIELQQAR